MGNYFSYIIASLIRVIYVLLFCLIVQSAARSYHEEGRTQTREAT